MTRDTLFHMYKPFRESLIERHEFYVRQASSRLLSQFDNIEDDAIRAAENWLERASQHFDPDRDDPGAFYEQAGNEEIGFYTLLTEIHEQTRLSVVAGMFHEWDKQFREWVAREIKHWHDGEALVTQIWAQTPHGIVDSLGMPLGGDGVFLPPASQRRMEVTAHAHDRWQGQTDWSEFSE